MKFRKLLSIILLLFVIFAMYLMEIKTYRYNFLQMYWINRTKINTFIYDNPEGLSAILAQPGSMYRDEISSINGKKLTENENQLSFFVAGHIYGDQTASAYHPAVTLVTNIQKINDFAPDLMIMLGDLTIMPLEDEYLNLEYTLFQPLTMPVFNAVGNHDASNRNTYVNHYGKTIYSFVYKNYLFIFLDTTVTPCALSDDQYEFISQQIALGQSEYELEGINIFLHHVLFWDKERALNLNTYKPNENCMKSMQFLEFVDHPLSGISEETPIYIFAGDVGVRKGQLSPYYEKIAGKEIYMYATGLGNTENDSILYVKEINGKLHVEPFALDGREMLPIECYDYTYWLK